MGETYTVKEVAEILGFSTNSIYAFLKSGRIKGIRVGEGRFRITEEELARILHLSKKRPNLSKETAFATVNTPKSSDPVEINLAIRKIPSPHVDFSSLFDWFVSLISILTGLSLLLYNQYFSKEAALDFVNWTLPLQVNLIAAGIGLFVSDIFRNKYYLLWRRIFLVILTLTHMTFAYTRYQAGEIGSGYIYGLLGISVMLDLIFQIAGVELLLFFISLYTIGSAFTLFSQVDTPQLISIAIESSPVAAYIFVFLSVIFAFLTWWSRVKNRKIFWLLMLNYGMVFALLSFWFAQNLSWSKAFFMLGLGLTSLLAPIWESLSRQKNIEKKLGPSVFLVILVTLSILMGTIWLMEQNMKDFANRELVNKLDYSKLLVESILENVENTVKGASRSRVLLDAIESDNNDNLISSLRIIKESNNYLRAVWILNSEGDIQSVYPHTILTQKNFFQRDYFRQAMNGKTYISNIFQAKTKDKRNSIVVSTPITSKKDNTPQGVLVVSLDLDILSNRLQSLTSIKNGEYIYLIDNRNRFLASPNKKQIGQLSDSFEMTAEEGIREFGKEQLVDKTGWRIIIRASIQEILRPTKTVSIAIFGAISFVILIISAYIFLVRRILLVSL